MLIRASDFINPAIFMQIAEEAQVKGLISQGPLSWGEKSVVDLDEIDINVAPIKVSL